MKRKIISLFFPVVATLLSTLLLISAFPTNDLSWLAWFALVPLLVGIYGRSPGYGFFLVSLCSVTFFAGIGNWLFEVRSYKILHHALFGLYLGLISGVFGFTFNFLSRRWGAISAFLAAPFIWVSLEYARANLGFLAFPWGLLAHSQYQYPKIIQIASTTGTYGISFLIVLVNSAFAAMVLALLNESSRTKSSFCAPVSKPGVIALAGAAAILTTLTLGYGMMTISKPTIGKGIRVAVIQGNIEQSKKWDPRYAEFIMETYTELTIEASKDRPALIIWPEAATPRPINLDRTLYSQVKTIAERARTLLLVGSSSHPKFKGGQKRDPTPGYRNSAFLIYPDGKTENQRYDKILLLPFGEFLPMKEKIPWSYIKIPYPGRYVPGNEFTVFEGPNFRFGVTICWETLFPDLVREFVNRRTEFIVNITNEAWFGKSSAPYQFLSMNVFRAVENRLFMVRCANTGISCFIDPYGRIVDRVKDASGQEIFVRGMLTETVTTMDSKTIYTQYGDWFAWLSISCSLGFLILAFLRKNPDQRSS